MASKKNKKMLKPAGHSATIERLIQPAIVIGSTLMSAIAAYVLGLDELNHILNGTGKGADYFVVGLCIGMGFLVDMAIIVSATHYKMHMMREDPKEDKWKKYAQWVLLLGLGSESMTLFYFFISLGASAFPDWLVTFAAFIHSVLAISRAFLPPVVITYFVAGLLPVVFGRGDRNREIKVRTSANIMMLIDMLSAVEETEDKTEMLKALGGQLVLDTYATYDETKQTTEKEQVARDVKLLRHLAKINGLEWDLVADLIEEAAEKKPVDQPVEEVTGDVPLFDLAVS